MHQRKKYIENIIIGVSLNKLVIMNYGYNPLYIIDFSDKIVYYKNDIDVKNINHHLKYYSEWGLFPFDDYDGWYNITLDFIKRIYINQKSLLFVDEHGDILIEIGDRLILSYDFFNQMRITQFEKYLKINFGDIDYYIRDDRDYYDI